MKLRQIITAAVFFILSGCNSVFFHPSKQQFSSPDELGLKYEEVTVNDGEGPKLYAWFLPAQDEPLGTIIHLHGNAENISTHLASVYWIPSQHFNLFTFDYRGYGASDGNPSFDGIHQDAVRAVKFLEKNYPKANKPFILYGQSLGGSVALYTASQPEMKKHLQLVIAESPFASYRSITRDKLNEFWLTAALQYPLSWTISSDYDAIKVIDKISPTPLFLIHTEKDLTIGVKHSKELYEKAKEPKKIWIAEEGEHIQAMQSKANRERFIAEIKNLTLKNR